MGADALKQALDAGAAALGLTLSPTSLSQLLRYLEMLQRWGRVYNLTAVREPQAMLVHHVLDSLSVVPALARFRGSAPTVPTPGADQPGESSAESPGADSEPVLRMADIGSGAGLPGLVLAVACPAVRVWCVDAVAKKISFIRQAAAEMGLPSVQAVHTRVEDWVDPEADGFDVVVSRAYASLGDFVSSTGHLLAPHGAWLAMKGRHPADEIAALPPEVEVFHVEPLEVPGLDAQRCVVWMKKRSH